jgi:hypothetical protein
MPYQLSDWQRFTDSLPLSATVASDTLCTTRDGRPVPTLTLRSTTAPPAHRVAVTCRHHCCEMMADYVLEGLARWALTADEPAADWLRRHVELLLIPFVDLDGVERGDQGKGRRPHDHGRDYQRRSRYPATRAIRRLLPAWGHGRLRVGIDLHCPHISGPCNEVIYLVGLPEAGPALEQRRFSALLETARRGPLPFSAPDFLAFGAAWNTAQNYRDGISFARWVAQIPGVALATTIEIPYADASGAEVNQETARAFGADLARALANYLDSLPPA